MRRSDSSRRKGFSCGNSYTRKMCWVCSSSTGMNHDVVSNASVCTCTMHGNENVIT